jgi:hypothetical protein
LSNWLAAIRADMPRPVVNEALPGRSTPIDGMASLSEADVAAAAHLVGQMGTEAFCRASLCCVPGGRDPILAILEGDSFVLESMHPERRATPMSVAAHRPLRAKRSGPRARAGRRTSGPVRPL